MLGTERRRDLFLAVLEQVRRRYQFVVLGYVVMPDDIHWIQFCYLLTPDAKNWAACMIHNDTGEINTQACKN